MDSRVSVSIANNKLTLSGIIDFESILSVNALGNEWISTLVEQECHIDFESVTYSNSAGLVLLLSWLRTAYKHKKNLQIISFPSSLKALVKVSGLDELFVRMEG
jgi:phospholipid transport system transporter-binding protein